MANREHLKILRQGVEVWNKWRIQNPHIKPDLELTDLSGTDLGTANLSGADLSGTDLNRANLGGANLYEADLGRANLGNTNLYGAHLSGADLSGTELYRADLREVDLRGAILYEAGLRGANITGAQCLFTIWGQVDLSEVIGLETIRHIGPSTIGLDTLVLSKGKIPEVFLRGCGVDENIITYV